MANVPAMTSPPPPAPRDEAEGLEAEAADHLAALRAAPPLPPIEKAKRSLPVSAPVSRDVPTVSGKKLSQETQITLSAEERLVAHGAYHWMPKGRAEQEYAVQKARMLQRRRDGLLNE